MRVLGIIGEYNPFHRGHLYHLQKSIDAVKPSFTIAIMSGNFTQRGEPAIVDKWTRTKMALKNGIHLVIELPVLYACQTAELFARGAISILHGTGLVSHLAFGSEFTDLNVLNKLAEILNQEPIKYKHSLKNHLNQGLSFPVARAKALEEYLNINNEKNGLPSELLNKSLIGSNSILAIEYLKALEQYKSPIKPVIIPRQGSAYNNPNINGALSSATAIRKAILDKHGWNTIIPTLPEHSLEILENVIGEGLGPISIYSFEQLILGVIRKTTAGEISSWMDVEPGLENRIKRSALESTTLNDFLSKVKTKRYTHTRLQRILVHGLLGIKSKDVDRFKNLNMPGYVRILGFNKNATPLLSRLKETSQLPIITKPAHYYRHHDKNLNTIFEYDVLATDLYALSYPNKSARKGGQELTKGIIII